MNCFLHETNTPFYHIEYYAHKTVVTDYRKWTQIMQSKCIGMILSLSKSEKEE